MGSGLAVKVRATLGGMNLRTSGPPGEETAIHLIGSTGTSTGIKVVCQRDEGVYETAQSVTDEEYATIPLTRLAPFESWNYVLNGHQIS
jgi:hypothetical protein